MKLPIFLVFFVLIFSPKFIFSQNNYFITPPFLSVNFEGISLLGPEKPAFNLLAEIKAGRRKVGYVFQANLGLYKASVDVGIFLHFKNFEVSGGAGIYAFSSRAFRENRTDRNAYFIFSQINFLNQSNDIFGRIEFRKYDTPHYKFYYLKKLASNFFVGPTVESQDLHGFAFSYEINNNLAIKVAGGFEFISSWQKRPMFSFSVLYKGY